MLNYNFGRPHTDAETGDKGIEYAPKPLIIDGQKVYTNDEHLYNQQGWYKVVETARPTREGYYYTPYWEIVDNTCEEQWEEHANPPEPEPTWEDTIEAQVMFTAIMTDTLLEEEEE